MNHHPEQYDVTDTVNTTDPGVVNEEMRSLFALHYPTLCYAPVEEAVEYLARLYRGEHSDYWACDTPYHNIQHVLGVALAMARLLDGYERSTTGQASPLDPARACTAFVTALFHDVGYLRHKHDTRHRHGAEYTLGHVARGAKFIARYLPTIGLGDTALTASKIVHYTAEEVSLEKLRIPDLKDHLLGCLLGTADLLAQMSDRCYLHKIFNDLYPEFVLGGLCRRRQDDGTEVVVYASAEDLLCKTPDFYWNFARKRLDGLFGKVYEYAAVHFGGRNYYMEAIEKNIKHLEELIAADDISSLAREPCALALLPGHSKTQESSKQLALSADKRPP